MNKELISKVISYNYNEFGEEFGNCIVDMKNEIERLNDYISFYEDLSKKQNKEIERLKVDYQQANEILAEQSEEIERLNNIINELEQWLNDLTILKTDKFGEVRFYDMVKIQAVLNKLQELKGSDKE